MEFGLLLEGCRCRFGPFEGGRESCFVPLEEGDFFTQLGVVFFLVGNGLGKDLNVRG